MDNIDTLKAYGLFDAKVRSYTSYPPANHFVDPVGQRHQKDWFGAVPNGSDDGFRMKRSKGILRCSVRHLGGEKALTEPYPISNLSRF